MTTTTHRPTETICPSWCAGHRDLYQSWEGYSGATNRDHASEPVEVGQAGVSVLSVEGLDHVLTKPVVSLFVGGDSTELTGDQAHDLGLELVRAAERLRRESGQ